jgi:hypothetical protein
MGTTRPWPDPKPFTLPASKHDDDDETQHKDALEVVHGDGHGVQHSRIDGLVLNVNHVHLLTDALHGSLCAQ